MKLSVRGEYAIRALTVLGEYHGPEVLRIQFVSARQNIPKRFLEQILNDLKAAGFVESRRGASGGYRLAMPPQKILLSQVIQHLEGGMAPAGCEEAGRGRRCSCPDPRQCPLRSVFNEVRDATANILENITIADLVARATTLRDRSSHEPDFVI